MPEYGATSNYKLPFPTDEADTDIAGDIKNLALGVDNAIGLNWDTATDEQKAAVGNATAPVRLFGSGRPDAAGLDLSAPVGSVFTCTDPLDDLGGNNLGAAVWRKQSTAWAVISGRCYKNESGLYLIRDAQTVFMSGSINPDVTPTITVEREMCFRFNAYVPMIKTTTFLPNGYAEVKMTGEITFNMASGGQHLFSMGGVPPIEWPTANVEGTETRTIDELRELIEEIEAEGESHPQWDTLQQLREELAQLTGTKPGDVS